MPSDREPETHIVNVQQAMDTLDYDELVALSQMYERWAFNEEDLTPDDRTKLVQLSSDYERIGQHVGPGWQARNLGPGQDAIQFVARIEKRDQRRRRAMSEDGYFCGYPEEALAIPERSFISNLSWLFRSGF